MFEYGKLEMIKSSILKGKNIFLPAATPKNVLFVLTNMELSSE